MANTPTKPVSLRIADSVRLAETQDGAVLLDIRQGLCFSINPVAVLIWKRVSEGCGIDEITEYLASTFTIPKEQARLDAEEFLQTLIEKRLVGASNGFKPRPARWRKIVALSGLFRPSRKTQTVNLE